MSSEQTRKSIETIIAEHCLVASTEDGIAILCPSDDIFLTLYISHQDILASQYVGNGRMTVTIATEERKFSFSPADVTKKRKKSSTMLPTNSLIKVISDQELAQEVLSSPVPAGIVRMRDSKVLFTNSLIEQTSACKPNDITGLRTEDLWFPDELSKYNRALLTDVELRNYSYKSRLFNGQAAMFKADVRLVEYRDDLCRLFHTHSCEKISF